MWRNVRAMVVMSALLSAVLVLPGGIEAQAPRLQQAHAHNDYRHARPLLDAVDRGFNSIEADVHLVDGQLLVAHDRDSVHTTRTLESLYLAPLRKHVELHGGWIRARGQPLTLLIDVKSDSEATYVVLDALLRRYADILTIFTAATVVEGPVVAVISGKRAIGAMKRAQVRFAALDGRLGDLEGSSRETRVLIPLVSDSWDRITKWKGEGPAPSNVRRDVARVVRLAHKNGQRIRFWGIPDNEAVWQLLLEEKVDLIGADDLDALRSFMLRARLQGSWPFPQGAPVCQAFSMPARPRVSRQLLAV